MSNENESVFPQDEAMYREIGKKLDEVKLNSEVLVTIVKELGRVSKGANHEQIHCLIELMQAILASLVFAHQVIVMRDGGHEHGRGNRYGD